MKTYNELLADFERLKTDIDTVREREARLIAERVLALLAESGVDLRALLDYSQSRSHERRRTKKQRAKAKYWNPETGVTWSGRGRMPRWLVGKDPESFRLPQDDAESGDGA
ncbi:H-NS histone family protein [Burkholderia gladioli]|uniref:H-NS histone family protein n=1 Tax=Burkholderia TaxID=32008 RepID=UPI0022028925|nr:H-NS histone family protein [Burkholderia glumae]